MRIERNRKSKNEDSILNNKNSGLGVIDGDYIGKPRMDLR